MGKVVIPFAKNKDTFQLRESSRELPIVKWLVLTIQVILRSVIPEALTRSNMSLFFANGINTIYHKWYRDSPNIHEFQLRKNNFG